MKGKKVLHIVSVSFSLRYFIGNQFHYFKERGYEFHVACSPSDELVSLSKEFGFEAFPVPILRSISPVQDIITIAKIYRYIRRENFDIVIAHSPKGGLLGMISGYLARVPKRIYFRHGLVFETAVGFSRKLLINIERITAAFSHCIVNVSPSIIESSNNLKLNPPHKNVLLGNGTCNGIDVNRFVHRPVHSDFTVTTIGFVGRLCKDKGIYELIGAWILLRKEYPALRLLLVGPLDERDKLDTAITDQIYADPAIEYVGEVDDTSPYYNSMDIFVLPSYREGFPTVTLEASASGLPVVTTRVTGCIDSIREQETGIYADNTIVGIYHALKFYIDHPGIAQQHGINGRAFVCANFSEEEVYQEIENELLS